MLAAVMSRIEAEVSVPAAPAVVWPALLDAGRWAAWAVPCAGEPPERLTLEPLELIDGAADGVGALRCGAAVVRVPVLGARTVRWVEQVTDVAAPRTIEFETLGEPAVSWRLRLWLVEQPDGDTRVRCRLSYRPRGMRYRLANALFLRRALERHAETMLAGLARSFAAAAPAELVEAEAETEPAEVEEIAAVAA